MCVFASFCEDVRTEWLRFQTVHALPVVPISSPSFLPSGNLGLGPISAGHCILLVVPVAMVLRRRGWKRGGGGSDMSHPVSGLGLERRRGPLPVLCGGICGGAVARRETDEHCCRGRRTNDK